MASNHPGLRLPIRLTPEYRDYVWGGNRLRAGEARTAEAWVVHEDNQVESAPFAGQTLAELSQRFGAELLGSIAYKRTGTRFPLLIKLLDSAQWLSLQVHPDDRQAERLEGAGNFGKTEAWHIIEAADNTQIIAGIKSHTTHQVLAEAIRNGTVLEFSRRLEVRAGDTIFMKPGTLHAMGPGLLVYEVQQTSDLTYRVYDWDRPLIGGRILHIDKSIEVVNPELRPEPLPLPALTDGNPQELCRNQYFTLEIIAGGNQVISQNTNQESFHAITVLSGKVSIDTQEASMNFSRFETALIPAVCGEYDLSPIQPYRLLRARVASH